MIKPTPFYGSSLFKTVLEKYGNLLPIVIQYDPDVDGVVAGYAVEEYLLSMGYKVKAEINSNRRHGILSTEMTNTLLINVDSGVSYDTLKTLVDNGNVVVSIDHHELEYGSFYEETEPKQKGLIKFKPKDDFIYYESARGTLGFIINNQYWFEDKNYRFFSGAGVVLEVLHSQYPKYFRKEHIAWNGLTLLSDIRDIENPIARKILEATYQIDVYNEATTLKHLVQQIGENPFAVGKFMFDRTYIDYNFNPVLNAMFRFNKGQDVIRLFRGYSIKDLSTIRDEQKDILETLNKRAKRIPLKTIEIVIVEKHSLDMFEPSNFIGYLANRYLDRGKSIVIICVENGQFVRGSFRGVYSNVDYRKVLEQNGLDVAGHKMAFGIKTFTSNLKLWKKIDEEIYQEERNLVPAYELHEIRDLKGESKDIRKWAYENQFLLSNHQHCIRYTGGLFAISKETKGMKEYKVGGLQVSAFDKTLTPKNAYIVPSMSNGFTSLILNKFPEKRE